MAFKNFKTYGRFRNRIIKTDVWISPERKRIFSSSDSTSTNSTENESRNYSSHDESSPSLLEMLPEDTDRSHPSIFTPSVINTEYFIPTNASKMDFSLSSTNNLNHVLEHLHSTPLPSKQTDTTIPQKVVTEISPLCEGHSNNGQGTNGFESDISPSLFSDSSSSRGSSLSEYDSKCEPKSGSGADDMVNLNDLKLTGQNHSGERNTPLSVDISNQMKNLCLLDAKVYLDLCEGSRALQRKILDKHWNTEPYKSLTSDQMTSQLCEENIGNRLHQNIAQCSFAQALTPIRFKKRKIPSAKEDILVQAKEDILVQCEQQSPLTFSDVFTQCVLKECVKVGEGTYGEVYKTNNGKEDIALKVIPVEGNFPVNNEPQKSFEEMIPEIVISKELSNLSTIDDVEYKLHICPNFIEVKRVMLVQDSYPQMFLHEWDKWKKNHKCENDRPDMFLADQYFIVFEFVDGGEDLECFEFGQMEEALSVLQQIVLSLSVSELSLKFEHRDLHWGNILIKRSNCQTIHYKLNGDDVYIDSCGVFVSIIDFTLSRLTKDGITVFCDLGKDPEIFSGKGDYQFQVYRLMRKANQDDWEAHVPYSNVLWIRYLVDKILNAKQYQLKDSGVQRNMRTLLRRILSYDSALNVVYDGVFGLCVPKQQN